MKNQMNEVTSESGLFTSNNLHDINRKGKPCIFSQKLKKNITKYLFDFLYYREISKIGCVNVFFYKCFKEYQMSNWQIEMSNIIDIFDLDIKNTKNEIDDSLISCIQNSRIYPMKNHKGNFIKIDKNGINIISIAFYDPEIQLLFNNDINDLNNISSYSNKFKNFSGSGRVSSFSSIDSNNDLNPWSLVDLEKSYINDKNHVLFLENTCKLNFGFSFHNVIKGNYKLFLNQSIINMKNANLILEIKLNDTVIFCINDFPNEEILKQFENNKNKNNNELKECFICDITEKMFENNNLKHSLSSSKTSASSNENEKYWKGNEIRIIFKNQHLFWKAGWFLEGGRLVRSNFKCGAEFKY